MGKQQSRGTVMDFTKYEKPHTMIGASKESEITERHKIIVGYDLSRGRDCSSGLGFLVQNPTLENHMYRKYVCYRCKKIFDGESFVHEFRGGKGNNAISRVELCRDCETYFRNRIHDEIISIYQNAIQND